MHLSGLRVPLTLNRFCGRTIERSPFRDQGLGIRFREVGCGLRVEGATDVEQVLLRHDRVLAVHLIEAQRRLVLEGHLQQHLSLLIVTCRYTSYKPSGAMRSNPRPQPHTLDPEPHNRKHAASAARSIPFVRFRRFLKPLNL